MKNTETQILARLVWASNLCSWLNVHTEMKAAVSGLVRRGLMERRESDNALWLTEAGAAYIARSLHRARRHRARCGAVVCSRQSERAGAQCEILDRRMGPANSRVSEAAAGLQLLSPQITSTKNNMGYSIYIGNAVVESDDEELYTRYVVEKATSPDAPRWPNYLGPDDKPDFMRGIDISEDTNGRHPSYTSMANWARDVGLYELFLGVDGRDGLLNPHPGCQRLTPGILAQISAARLKWEESHAGAKPGWRDGEDPTLAKLIWYEWWVKWALENCKIPAISNS